MAGRNKWSYTTGKKYKERPIGTTHVKKAIQAWDKENGYIGLDIGTGKDLSEYQFEDGRVPYHMIDIEDVNNIYTLFHYQRDCYEVLRGLSASGGPVLMVGGTGLYIEAVLKKYGIANVPENARLRKDLMEKDREELLESLKQSDPDLFQSTDVSSKKRIVRALEICEYSKSNEVQYTGADDINITSHIFCLCPRLSF